MVLINLRFYTASSIRGLRSSSDIRHPTFSSKFNTRFFLLLLFKLQGIDQMHHVHFDIFDDRGQGIIFYGGIKV